MISDILSDAAIGIRKYRDEFPDIYGRDQRMNLWLDAITAQLEALSDAYGMSPPPDDRTIRGECRDCHEITTISLDNLACEDCTARNKAGIRDLVEAVIGGDPDDPAVVEAHHEALYAEMAADRAEWLNESVARALAWLRRLNRADRDAFLNAITRGLLDAR
jgi:hypothetical protein